MKEVCRETVEREGGVVECANSEAKKKVAKAKSAF